MAKLGAAANIEETHTDGLLKNRREFTAGSRRKTAEVPRGRPSERSAESIEETHLTECSCR